MPGVVKARGRSMGVKKEIICIIICNILNNK